MPGVQNHLMIVSPGLLPNSPKGTGIVLQKILEVQQQIVMLNRHEREHISATGAIIKVITSCHYCQLQSDSGNWEHHDSNKQGDKTKKIATLNEIEREVEMSGKNGCVIVPKTWAGKRVRLTLLEDDAEGT